MCMDTVEQVRSRRSSEVGEQGHRTHRYNGTVGVCVCMVFAVYRSSGSVRASSVKRQALAWLMQSLKQEGQGPYEA